MNYPFESLDPEVFQQFCQALLAREFPNVQCFPVAQPDGGRDAISLSTLPGSTEFLTFQVKFVRDLSTTEDPHRWLAETLEDEVPKVKKLLPKGAVGYYVLTNVAGTAHPDVGSIDRVAAVLRKYVPIPSMCWWRDDLNRRLDSAWDLKWRFPQLMTGPDLLRAVFESGLSEHRERRTLAVRAFVRDQLNLDREVRFKQVDLQNELLDLFVDVPVAPGHAPMSRTHRIALMEALKSAPKKGGVEEKEYEASAPSDRYVFTSGERVPSVGAATLLLTSAIQLDLPQVVLEGAPGQGKSTITQYISQIHRMRLLNDSGLTNVEAVHRGCPVRLPFRVDLRDLATWLTGKDPFSSGEGSEKPGHWHKSLQSFLAAQVRHHSGAEFTVDDLYAVFRLSSVLLVFDGLDEVADIATRREVVEEIELGVSRLREVASSIQVIVTSRPAAFANSPGLPPDKFPYLQLESLSRVQIDEYAEKWLRARRLHSRESTEVKEILKQKLGQPHLRELARNPMQLTILLSLIHTRGSSLPDKRTALYDSYIDLFFSREASKSAVVRDHRDLLIDIHRYLAWILHSEAEQGRERGLISYDRLQALVSGYLEREGHDVRLAKLLFTGLVERVVALVSRVEGTYEFEVQPLREYFAARYLYDTAPYSPPGNEHAGTKPDRFDALARNFYWLNVTRFFSGCFSKGELASLIERLRDLLADKSFRYTMHPRMLGAMLLSDWVFSQYPKSVDEVVTLISDSLGLRCLASSYLRRPTVELATSLPDKSGRNELVDRCFKVLGNHPAADFAMDVISIIRANATQEEISERWKEQLALESGCDRTEWLKFGFWLHVFQPMSLSEVTEVIPEDDLTPSHLELLLHAKRFDYFAQHSTSFRSALEGLLNCDIELSLPQRTHNALEVLHLTLDPERYAIAFQERYALPLTELWARTNTRRQRFVLPTSTGGASQDILDFIEVVRSQALQPSSRWAQTLEPWDTLVTEATRLWGSRWSFWLLATVAAGIKSTQEQRNQCDDLFDSSVSICGRARYARLRAGSRNWWKSQIGRAKSEEERSIITLLLFTWASSKTLSSLMGNLTFIDELSPFWWRKTADGIKRCCSLLRRYLTVPFLGFDTEPFPKDTSLRLVSLLTFRTNRAWRAKLFLDFLAEYKGDDSIVLAVASKEALAQEDFGRPGWKRFLPLISKAHQSDVSIEHHMYFPYRQFAVRRPDMSIEIAEEILAKPDCYPGLLVAFSENRCRDTAANNIVAVGRIAAKDDWFGSMTLKKIGRRKRSS